MNAGICNRLIGALAAAALLAPLALAEDAFNEEFEWLPVAGQNPDGEHGLAKGAEFTVRPGATGKHGYHQYSCPAGGPACVLRILDDGTIAYRRSGGVPVIPHPLPLPGKRLPSNHGLARGAEFTLQAGVTEKRANVEFSCPAGGPDCIVSVTYGLQVRYHPSGGIPSAVYVRPGPVKEVHATFIPSGPDEHGTHSRFPPGVNYQVYVDVDLVDDQAPVMEFGRTLHVGADVAPPAEALLNAGALGDVILSKGQVRDGHSAAEVLDYLKIMANSNLEDGLAGLQRWNSTPKVQLVGTDVKGKQISLTRAAGQIVNAALPFARRMKLQLVNMPITPDRAEFYYRVGYKNIFVWFMSRSDPQWGALGNYESNGDEIGMTRVLKRIAYVEQRQRWEVGLGEGALRADILIDTDAIASFSDSEVTYLMVHEFLHAMGFMSHAAHDRFQSTLSDAFIRGTEPRSLIHSIDREGLLAAYSRFKAGTLDELMTPETLGPWSDTSIHARGDLLLPSGNVSFGVAFRNRLPQPWARGAMPDTRLAHNAALSGQAVWQGALLGMTPAGEAVSGDYSLTVNLSRVRKEDGYTPGSVEAKLALSNIRFEDGSSWGDGDLAYSINVTDKGFQRARSSFVRYSGGYYDDPYYAASGEDFGVVTGTFFGNAHEGSGGVIERYDLSATFGGKLTRTR